MTNNDLELKRTKCEVYSRVVGWIVPVQQWNEGKKSEFIDRRTFDKQLDNNN
ncbi:MAG: anaerobic ribonucleoside-triphosphate reductase [Patescibacteria group bacterium]